MRKTHTIIAIAALALLLSLAACNPQAEFAGTWSFSTTPTDGASLGNFSLVFEYVQTVPASWAASGAAGAKGEPTTAEDVYSAVGVMIDGTPYTATLEVPNGSSYSVMAIRDGGGTQVLSFGGSAIAPDYSGNYSGSAAPFAGYYGTFTATKN